MKHFAVLGEEKLLCPDVAPPRGRLPMVLLLQERPAGAYCGCGGLCAAESFYAGEALWGRFEPKRCVAVVRIVVSSVSVLYDVRARAVVLCGPRPASRARCGLKFGFSGPEFFQVGNLRKSWVS